MNSTLEQAKGLAHEIVEEAKTAEETIRSVAAELGCSEVEVRRLVKQQAYRINYNQKPEVKAKRAEYNKRRQLEIKALRQLATTDPHVGQLLAACISTSAKLLK